MSMNNVSCATITDYRPDDCQEVYKGGVDIEAYISEYASDQIASIAKGATANGATAIRDITMQSGRRMYALRLKEDSGLGTIKVTKNDNNNLDEVDSFSAQFEYQEPEHHDYFKNLIKPNVYLVLLMPLSGGEDRYMCFGHSGGFKMIDYEWTSGKRGEFTGFTAEFTNNTQDTGLSLVADETEYTGGNAELIAELAADAA